ncbi:MAG: NAD(P)/FAD-dependent oxidoreductase [Vulcanococcus sp.]
MPPATSNAVVDAAVDTAVDPAVDPVIVVGGGFGGLTTALNLAAAATGVPVLLIEPQERFLFLPLLYELLSAELRRWEIAPRYADLLAGRGVAWLQERVVAIHHGQRRLRTDGGRELAYSALVVATGGRAQTYGIPGVLEHALSFRTLADVDRLQQLVRRLRLRRQPQQRLAVVGAGASGVELACKLADLLEGAAQIELIEQGGELLPGSRAFNREQAHQALQRRAVRLRTHTRVAAVHATGLDLQPGADDARLDSPLEPLACEAVIWTGGVAACLPEFSPTLALDRRGRLPCDAQLRVIGTEAMYALGDAAACPLDDTSSHPATAQVAYQQASCVAANLQHQRRGEPLEAFRWNDLGEMLGLGVGEASLTGMGLTLAGPAAFQLRRLAYLARLPGPQHQLRVARGWLSAWL